MKAPNLEPITEENIKGIITSPKFLSRLREAAERIWKDSGEAGFCVVRDIHSKITYGKVITHPEDKLDDFDGSIRDLLDDQIIDHNMVYRTVELHFHPFLSNFFPSYMDLCRFLSAREEIFNSGYGLKIDFKPISIVGSMMTAERKIELLLLQETGALPLGISQVDSLVNFVEGSLDRIAEDNQSIAKAFDQYAGLQADCMTFERTNGAYRLKQEDYGKISRFASKPKFLGCDSDLESLPDFTNP